MKETEVAVVGAGPAGLQAAIELAKADRKVTLIDENQRPGGQLFKQIHKFFGSREHKAGMRGFRIGEQLLKETEELGVEVLLESPVYAIYQDFVIGYIHQNREYAMHSAKIILATGASENALAFRGGTLPGVMGAGAAQTMINVNRVLPGKKILMIGSGNVGLIVSYQLLQAGAEVVAVVEAAPEIGGYGVHASKIRRAGVPIYISHTIKEACGTDSVEYATIVGVDEKFLPISGSEKKLEVDTICVAVGLNPLIELATLAGCECTYVPELGGQVPKHDRNMETTIKGLYVAGDLTGVEEASSAMEEGRLAGIACAESLNAYEKAQADKLKCEAWERLDALRTGPFGQRLKDAKSRILDGVTGGCT